MPSGLAQEGTERHTSRLVPNDQSTGSTPTTEFDATGAEGLRVLFLCEGNAETFDSWSGVSRSVIRHLREQGHVVRVGDADLYGARRLLVALRSITWPRKRWWVQYHLGEAGFRARSAACARVVARRGGKPDVVIQVGATFVSPPVDGAPLVLYCDSNIEFSRRGALTGQSEATMLSADELREVREREAAIYRQASLIFTMSEQVRQSFIADFGIPAERLVTVHCGPNTDSLARDTSRAAPPPAAPTVLFVGRDFQRKGGQTLLDAFRIVRQQLPAARLRMVGGRPPNATNADGVEYLGFLSRDTTAGREAMDQAYRSASVFCIPTRFEPFGTSFVEAMTYGIPCVGPDVWAVPEIIRHEETGLLVPPEDAGQLASALLRVLTDPVRAQAMGEAARERVERHFSWEAVARKMSRALLLVARPGRATTPATGA